MRPWRGLLLSGLFVVTAGSRCAPTQGAGTLLVDVEMARRAPSRTPAAAASCSACVFASATARSRAVFRASDVSAMENERFCTRIASPATPAAASISAPVPEMSWTVAVTMFETV